MGCHKGSLFLWICMSDLVFKISPDIICGSFVSLRAGQFIKKIGKKFLIIIESGLKKSDFAKKIFQSLDENEIKYFTYENLIEGASSKEIGEAVSIAKEAYIDGVISIGRENSINFGKAVASLVNEKSTIYDLIDGEQITEKSVLFVALPTVFRESFLFSDHIPITDSRSNKIKILKSQEKLTNLVIWDSESVKMLGDELKNQIILQMISDGMECYISPKSNFFSDMFVEKSFELLGRVLMPQKFDSVDSILKEEILVQAGMMLSISAEISGLGFSNLLALAFNSRFRIETGKSAAVLFPFVLKDTISFASEKISKLSKLIKFADENDETGAACEKFLNFVNDFISKNDLPTKMSDLNIDIQKIALVSDDASQIELVNNLAKSVTSDSIFEFLKGTL